MHTCYGTEKLNACPFHHLSFRCDLVRQTILTNVTNRTLPRQGQRLCHIIFYFERTTTRLCHLDIYAYMLWHEEAHYVCPFYHLPVRYDLDRQTILTNITNRTLTGQGQRLCPIILKVLHKYTINCPTKLNI